MKIRNVRTYGLEESIVASGFPMQTETLDEEEFDAECELIAYGLEFGCEDFSDEYKEVFDKHIKRIKNLGKAKQGSGHDCAVKGVIVQFNITAPQYFWLQFERYHFQDTVSSKSTMHRIVKMDIQKQMNEYVLQSNIDTLQKLIDLYNNFTNNDLLFINKALKELGCKVEVSNLSDLFQIIISNTPEGFELTRRITTSYLQLKSMLLQRELHKLKEWREIFCPWVLSLPHFKEFIIKGEN